MKKVSTLIILVLVLALALSAFAGCKPNEGGNDDAPSGVSVGAGESYEPPVNSVLGQGFVYKQVPMQPEDLGGYTFVVADEFNEVWSPDEGNSAYGDAVIARNR